MNGAQSRLHMLLLYRSDFSSLVSDQSTGPPPWDYHPVHTAPLKLTLVTSLTDTITHSIIIIVQHVDGGGLLHHLRDAGAALVWRRLLRSSRTWTVSAAFCSLCYYCNTDVTVSRCHRTSSIYCHADTLSVYMSEHGLKPVSTHGRFS